MTSVRTRKASLRSAAPEDREFLVEVYASTRTEELAAVPWDDATKAAFLRMQSEAQEREYAGRGVVRFVVEAGGERIGRLYRRDEEGTIHLVDVALLPAWRGRGTGSALVAGLLAEADAKHAAVQLYVERWNIARRLYDRLGFQPVTTGDVYTLMRRPPT